MVVRSSKPGPLPALYLEVPARARLLEQYFAGRMKTGTLSTLNEAQLLQLVPELDAVLAVVASAAFDREGRDDERIVARVHGTQPAPDDYSLQNARSLQLHESFDAAHTALMQKIRAVFPKIAEKPHTGPTRDFLDTQHRDYTVMISMLIDSIHHNIHKVHSR